MSLLVLEGVNAYHDAAQALFDVSLTVAPGEVVALVGRNGAGKSTTLQAVMGIVGRRGAIRFDGHRIDRMATYRIARRGVGWVPEDRRIFGQLTVLENLAAGTRPPRAGALRSWTVERVFTLFPNLAAMPERRGDQMSGGEQQMLAVARTLMANPRLVLLDEPSEGVAPIVVAAMAEAIEQMKAAGIAVLLSEQNLAFARRLADRVVVLESGRVAYAGSMAEWAEAPQLAALRERTMGV